MSLQVTIGFNPEALSAIADLTAAIRGISGGTTVNTAPATTTKPAATKTTPKPEEKEAGPVTWANHTKGTHGEVADEAAFAALKKKDAKIVKTTAAQHAALVAKAEEAASEEEEEEVPSEEDVLNAFGGYLPTDLDKAERAERAKFVKPLLARFGADKASKLAPEHRKLAINLVLRKAAGQDIDPETDDYEEFEAEEEGLV